MFLLIAEINSKLKITFQLPYQSIIAYWASYFTHVLKLRCLSHISYYLLLWYFADTYQIQFLTFTRFFEHYWLYSRHINEVKENQKHVQRWNSARKIQNMFLSLKNMFILSFFFLIHVFLMIQNINQLTFTRFSLWQ